MVVVILARNFFFFLVFLVAYMSKEMLYCIEFDIKNVKQRKMEWGMVKLDGGRSNLIMPTSIKVDLLALMSSKSKFSNFFCSPFHLIHVFKIHK